MSNVIPLRPTPWVSHGLVHIWPEGDGFAVHHESASSESFALLERFGSDEREQAVEYALGQLDVYSPCKLGEVAPWHS